ncbi:MAG: threonine/serine exporter family protein [Nocardioidaceae bacterium]|nr:threonine/serine exporter family protein [Nocardioidaceae bacterium]
MVEEASEIYRSIDLALRVGEVVMSSGAGAADVSATMLAVTSACGLRGCVIDVNFTTLTVAYQASPDVAPETHMRVVRYRGQEYGQLTEVDTLVRDLSTGRIDREGASRRLNEILWAPRPYPRWAVTVSTGALAGGVTLLLGGDWLIMLVAIVAAITIDLSNRALANRRVPVFYAQVLGAFIATSITLGLFALDLPIRPSLVIAASIIVLLAGASLVGSVQDALTGYYVTAAARTFEVILLTAGIIAGITLALSISNRLGLELSLSATTTTWSLVPLALLGGTIAAVAFAFGCQAPARALVPIGLTALVGQAFFLVADQAEIGVAAASAVAATAVGLVSYTLAGRVRVPALIVVVSAIVPLLPGLTIYRGLFQLSENDIRGAFSLLTAFSIGIALAAGVYLGEYVAQPLRREARRLETRLAGPRLVGPLVPVARRAVRRRAARRHQTDRRKTPHPRSR